MRRLAAVLCAGVCAASLAHDGPGRVLDYPDYRPAALALATEDRELLGYAPDELPRAQRADIDGDGIADTFVIAAQALCGTAGCPVLLLDGRSGHRLGEFFGAVAVLDRRQNRRALIQVLSRRDLERTNLETHAFDGEHYRLVEHRLLDAEEMNAWRAALDSDRAR